MRSQWFVIHTLSGQEQKVKESIEKRIKAATIIQYRLRAIGIEVKIRTVEWAAFIKEFVDKRRFEAVILGWTISQDPDNYDVWHSSKAVRVGLALREYSYPCGLPTSSKTKLTVW